MTEYATKWLDYTLPTGEEFAVGVCGYNGRVRHMTIGEDPIRRALAKFVKVEGESCSAAQHCLDLDCPLNKTSRGHVAHMLDMREDEPVDAEVARLWGKESTIDCFLELIRKINQELPQNTELKRENKDPGNQGD